MPDDAIERARECLARTMEEFGGDARLSCAADIRRDVGNEYWDVPIRAMIVFASQQAPEGWRPIDTAPKDGRMVDLWQGGERWPDSYWEGGMWWGGCLQNPTHWRPLPTPPAMLDAAPSVTLGEVG